MLYAGYHQPAFHYTTEADMAVNIKMIDGYKFLGAVGLPADQIDDLQKVGVKVQIQATKAVFQSVNGATMHMVPVKLDVVQKIMDGTMGIASVQAVRMKMAKGAESVLKKFEDADKFNWDAPLEEVTVPITQDTDGILGVQEAAAVTVDLGDTVDVNAVSATLNKKPAPGHAKVGTGSPVKLVEATEMYQPVGSTSSGSVYHVFGITTAESLKVAARYKGTSLSVRVEGDVAGMQNVLEKAGFPMDHLSAGYVSMHLEAPDVIMANRAIGAVLCGLGMPLKTPLPDIGQICGKGA